LRSAPGRGSSLNARSKIAFHEAPLVRYNVEPLTAPCGHLFIAAAGIAASNIWARLSLAGGSFALAQHRGEFTAFAWLNSIR